MERNDRARLCNGDEDQGAAHMSDQDALQRYADEHVTPEALRRVSRKWMDESMYGFSAVKSAIATAESRRTGRFGCGVIRQHMYNLASCDYDSH